MTVEADREQIYQQCGRNIMLNKEFCGIIDCFSNDNIPVMGLKGISLIQDVIDPGERYVGDIDILVKPENVLKAAELLRELGYSGSDEYFDPEKPYSIYLNSLTFSRSYESSYYVHLHWHILNTTLPLFMYDIDMDRIWQEAEHREIEGRGLLFPSPAHSIVYLSIHAFNHSYRKLSLLDDLMRLIEFYRGRLDWENIIETADKWGAKVPLYCSLALVRKIYELGELDPVLADIWSRRKLQSVEKIINAVENDKAGTHNMVFPAYVYMAGGFCKKIKFLVLSVFPPYKVLYRVRPAGIRGFRIFEYFSRLFWGICNRN